MESGFGALGVEMCLACGMPLVEFASDDDLILQQVVDVVWDVAFEEHLVQDLQHGSAIELGKRVSLVYPEDS